MELNRYFDYNSTTPTDQRVVEEMKPYFFRRFHNPSSFYRGAGEANYAVEQARKRAARLINAKPNEIFFTSGGTESDNMALLGVVSRLRDKGNHIITSAIEHPAVLNTCKYLKKMGHQVTILPVSPQGLVDPDGLKKAITAKTILISIMYANNETGTIQPLKELVTIAHDKGILFHSDAVQAAGKIPLDVNDLDVDLLSLASHKIYGPKGVGLLYKKNGLKIDPIFYGGGHEKGLRVGTENVPGIVGMGLAAKLALNELDVEDTKVKPLRDKIERLILEKIPEAIINGDRINRLPNTLNVSLKYIEGESVLAMLDQEGFSLSSGSACSSKSLDPSHVLLAMGLKHEDAHGSLRISLGKYNNQKGVNDLLASLPPIVARLREISPFWKQK